MKCDFCRKEKKTKTIHSTNEKPIRYEICKDCANIECPYLDWDKLLDYNKLEVRV